MHLVICEETWTDGKGEEPISRWSWISNQPLTQGNVIERCNQVGRSRWQIECNILVLKHYGDHYEHAYSYDWKSMQGWHYLMKLRPSAERPDNLDDRSRQGSPDVARLCRSHCLSLRDTWTGRWLSRGFFESIRGGEAASP